jgi:3-oxoadipate enol-lactonase
MSPLLLPPPTPHVSGFGEPLVLLHCLGVDHRFWDFATALEDQFRIVRYDLPGHGETPVPASGYAIEDLSAQLAALLGGLGIARAHVAGISMGGLVAQHFAATCPDRVNRLVLIDTTPRYVEELRTMWAVRGRTARESGVAALVPGLLDIWFSPQFRAADPPALRYVQSALEHASGEGYALACEALAAADLRPCAAKITAPTLVICGERDIPSFLDAARWLQQNIPAARLEWIAGARHASVIEKPDDALRLMRSFLLPGI